MELRKRFSKEIMYVTGEGESIYSPNIHSDIS